MNAIYFDTLPWESPVPGARFKALRGHGKQVRLLELTSDFVELHWCDKGHAGLVLSGTLEIDFQGELVHYPEGAALLIPPGRGHKARVVSGVTRLFLVEDA